MGSKTLSIILSVKNKMAAGISAAKSAMASGGRAIASGFQAAAAAVAAVGTGMIAAMKHAENFRASLAKITTESGMSSHDAGKVAMSISSAFGIAKDEIVEAMHGALSEGVRADDAEAFVSVAAKLAKATGGSTVDAVKALTVAQNAYGLSAQDAAATAETLYQNFKLGAGGMDILAGNLATVAPEAARVGVSLSDLVAAFATLHGSGTDASQSANMVRGAIRAMNITLGDSWANTMNLQEGMEAIRARAGGSAAGIKALAGRWDGANAIISMTGEYAASATAALEQVSGASGTLQKDFAKIAGLNPLAKLTQTAGNLGTTVGNAGLALFGPQLEKINEKMAALAQKAQELTSGRGLIAARQFAEVFCAELANAVKVGIARFGLFGTAVRDTFTWLSGTIGAHVGIWVERIKYAAAYASAIWAKIKSPSSDFERPDEAGIDAAKDKAAALHARTWEEIYADTLDKSAAIEKIQEAHDEKLLAIEQKYVDRHLAQIASDAAEKAANKAQEDARQERLGQLRKANDERLAEESRAAARQVAEKQALEERLADLQGRGIEEAEAAAEERNRRLEAAEEELTRATEEEERARAALHATPQQRRQAQKEAAAVKSRERYEARMRELLANPRFLNGTMKMSNKLAEYKQALDAQRAAAAKAANAKTEAEASLAALERIREETKTIGEKIDELNAALVGG